MAATMSESEAAALRAEGEKKMTITDRVVNEVVQPAMLPLMERGLVPDRVMRFGINKLLASTLNVVAFNGDVEKQSDYMAAFVEDLKSRNIAEQTGAANDQHYEVPAEFYQIMLGPYLKYSSGLWPSPDTSLEESEEHMLKLFCERAGLPDLAEGSTVLDLGCGWGSLTLFAAQRFKKLKFTCVSNSNSQREFITQRAKDLGLTNVEPRTCDINVMSFPEGSFDRVMSVEMFEHMKNYQRLLHNISTWLKPQGKLLIHIFVHDRYAYHFQDGWMAETFFTGGTMPSKNLMMHFNEHMRVERQWSINGTNYSRTLEAWMKRIDEKANKEQILKQFTTVYGEGNELKFLNNWRVFCMACSELFAYNGGNEWYVQHLLFSKTADAKPLAAA